MRHLLLFLHLGALSPVKIIPGSSSSSQLTAVGADAQEHGEVPRPDERVRPQRMVGLLVYGQVVGLPSVTKEMQCLNLYLTFDD